MRPFALALFTLVALALPALAQSTSAIPYTPPAAPPPPDLFGAAVRLLALTALTLAICGGVIWWARRATRKQLLAPNADGRLVFEARLPLDARNALHLIRVDGHPVIVTTDVTGIKSIVPMQPTFDAALDDAAEPEPEQASATSQSGNAT